jgi:6-phosphogluconolactonase
MALSPEIRILEKPGDLFEAGARIFVAEANNAVDNTGRFTVALSGGSTPKGLYSLLASGRAGAVPWENIHFFWGDERHVPPNHADSNYRMANEAMLAKVPVPAQNIHRVHAEDAAQSAAAAYEQELVRFFQLQQGQFPRFDLIFLGMGPDGHTASLFPGSPGLSENHRLVIANWVEKFNAYRITFTFPVLNHAQNVLFLVGGADKASALHKIFDNENEGEELPAGRIHPSGKLIWLVERPAASLLSTIRM